MEKGFCWMTHNMLLCEQQFNLIKLTGIYLVQDWLLRSANDTRKCLNNEKAQQNRRRNN